jgi:hypothetical protein
VPVASLHRRIAVTDVVCDTHTPTHTTQPICQLQLTIRYQTVTFALTGLIITAVNFFKPSDSSAPKSGSDAAEISPWLISVMSNISAGLPFWLPGILLAITLRFDYARDRSVALPNTHKTSDPVDVPANVPHFRPTLFNAGLAGTALSLVAARVVVPWFTASESDTENQARVQLIGMFLCLVCVPGAIALRVRSQGVLRDWWNYEET